MKIKPGFILRKVADQNMVIAVGEASKKFHGMIKLNETGAVIWESISQGLTEVQISKKLVGMYGIAPERATEDVQKMVKQMRKAGFLIDEKI